MWMAESKVVILTTVGAANNENSAKITIFLFQLKFETVQFFPNV